MQTLMGVQEDFMLNTEVDRDNTFMLTHPHQDPDSAALDILELLEALIRDPDEECIAVVQPK